jgi:hypothetical protein
MPDITYAFILIHLLIRSSKQIYTDSYSYSLHLAAYVGENFT